MEFWDVITERHSTRDYLPDPVPREKLQRVLHAAALAPSAMNEQPYRFHVAEGEARQRAGAVVAQATVHLEEFMKQLGPEHYATAVEWYSSLGQAPIVIGVSMPQAESDLDSINKLLSVGAALENLMLAATAEGLATCNITFAWWVRDQLAEAFEVEPGHEMVAILALGMPSETPPLAPPHSDDVADWLDDE
jgi:nitroreductase